MREQSVDKFYIRHLILYEFRKPLMPQMPLILLLIPVEFDKDLLLAEIETDPKQTIQELITKLKTELHGPQYNVLSRLDRDPFLRQIVSGDEQAIHIRKKPLLISEQPPLPTPKQGLYPKKNYDGISQELFYYEVLNPIETITAEYYCAQLDRLTHGFVTKTSKSD
ncbi:hypothetical protein E2986_13978 [Frieseomelitta varia]|uniref:Uncharacterized protein n=1 Tax=Frieseomelitta varia TaxID=561572 RepID=A0A833VMZ5_9HYME|nr:hypothetical protein E2986_13978 [Frieseomelitta varia]